MKCSTVSRYYRKTSKFKKIVLFCDHSQLLLYHENKWDETAFLVSGDVFV